MWPLITPNVSNPAINDPNLAKSLYDEVRTCQVCVPHLPHGPRPVFQMDAAARILIVGQAPGRRVHESGKPFDDPSGDRLRRWLGVDPVTFYDPKCFAILPMGLCYPGTGPSGDLPPRPECAVTWRAKLLATLPNISMTLVIGQYAHAWHFGNKRGRRLVDTVANWREFWPTHVPMPHPSPRNMRWFRSNPWFEADVVPAIQQRVRVLCG